MSVIDPRVTFNEAKHIFESIDTTKDGKINFQEFQQLFCKYDF